MASQYQLKWVRASNGGTASSAVLAGVDANKDYFVIRANHNGGIIPGKLQVKSPPYAYISYGGKEITVANYEVLVAPGAALSWVESSGGNIPALAVLGGADPNGDKFSGVETVGAMGAVAPGRQGH